MTASSWASDLFDEETGTGTTCLAFLSAPLLTVLKAQSECSLTRRKASMGLV